MTLIAVVAAAAGCHHAYSVPHSTASTTTPVQEVATSLLVRVSDAGAPIGEDGVAITKEGIEAKLAAGALNKGTPVRIAVQGTQKKGVLEASEMFASLGFRSVTIVLILTDPIR